MMKNIFQKLLLSGVLISSLLNTQKTEALVTHSLNYRYLEGPESGGSLTGSITFDETSVQTGTNQFRVVNNELQLPTWVTNLTFAYFDGNTTTNYSITDFQTMDWVPSAGVTPDYTEGTNLVPQFDTINFIAKSGAGPRGSTGFITNVGNNEYELTSTPFPVGFSILPVGFLFYKKLKNIKGEKLKS